MVDFWDQKFGQDKYVYGTNANAFLVEQLEKLECAKALFPAEGEGRNAVYAAQKGWNVSAFDPSKEGKKKAEKLAQTKGVSIQYDLAGYQNYSYPAETFDLVVLIFAHMPSKIRSTVHQKLISTLKPGGTLLLQAFTKNQLSNTSGGPKDLDMLYSTNELKSDFNGVTSCFIEEVEGELNEGALHLGKAALINVVLKK